jgi:hypothetical protein
VSRRALLFAFGVTALVEGAAWIAWSPFGGYPDERDHFLRAAAIANGEWIGDPDPRAGSAAPSPDCCETSTSPRALWWVRQGARSVEVDPQVDPRRLACDDVVVSPRSTCEAQEPRSTHQTTTMGTVEPTGYLAPAALIAFAASPSAAFQLARIANFALALLLMGVGASAWLATASKFVRVERVLGLALATSPMLIFVSSSGSPNALEVSSALGFTCLLLAASREQRLGNWQCAALATSGAILALSRSLGPLYVAAIVAAIALVVGIDPLLRPIGRTRLASGVLLVAVPLAMAATVMWEVLVQPHSPIDIGFFAHQVAAAARDDLPRVAREVVGAFGSLDVPLPRLMTTAYALSVVALIVVAVARVPGSSRLRLITCLAALVVLVPVIAAATVRHNGFALQGRHVLPLAVLIPLLPAELLARENPLAARSLACPALVVVASHLYAIALATVAYVPAPGRGMQVDPHGPNVPVVVQASLGLVLAVAIAQVASAGWRRRQHDARRRS